MEPVTLGKLGTVRVVQPASFAVISDLCAEWNENASRAKLARLCAAAVGACWDRQGNTTNPPRYDVTAADPVGYGGRVLDWLHGQAVPMSTVYDVGGNLIGQLFQAIPTEVEVTAVEDFSEPGSEQSTE